MTRNSLRSAVATAIAGIACIVHSSTALAASCTPSGSYQFVYPAGSYLWEMNNPFGDQGSTTSGMCVVNTAVYNPFAVAWYAQWKQSSGQTYNVYGYPEVLLDNKYSQTNLPRTISSITSIPSTWNYNLTAQSSTGYDVAYDLWVYPTTSTSGTATAEIMIWTSANFKQSGDNVGTFTFDGINFTLYQTLPAKYPWTNHPVYSFVANQSVNYITGDLKQFITDLTQKGYFSTSKYLTSVEAGVEVRGSSGTGSLTTYNFTASVNHN